MIWAQIIIIMYKEIKAEFKNKFCSALRGILVFQEDLKTTLYSLQKDDCYKKLILTFLKKMCDIHWVLMYWTIFFS